MDPAQRIGAIIEAPMADMGYELVRVQLTGTQRQTLQVMAERADGENMTVDDCADISRAVSALLDVEDPIHGSYTLEVSSPGIDRPLTRPKDYVRYAGFEAKVEMSQVSEGRKRFRGRLLGLENETVKLRTEKGDEVDLPFREIARAKLVLTDELIAASQGAGSN